MGGTDYGPPPDFFFPHPSPHERLKKPTSGVAPIKSLSSPHQFLQFFWLFVMRVACRSCLHLLLWTVG